MTRLLLLPILLLVSSVTFAQDVAGDTSALSTGQANESVKPFSSLSLSFTAGTVGLGFDLEAPVTSWLKVRAGASFMPHVNINKGDYVIHVGENPDVAKDTKIFNTLTELTSYKVNPNVAMERQPVMNNAKLLFDIYPLKNKDWHATVGVYYGSRQLYRGENKLDEGPSLMSFSMYNNLHRMAVNDEPIVVGKTYVYLADNIVEKLLEYGSMGIPVGKFANDIFDDEGKLIHEKGSMFNMLPDQNCMITEKSYVNKFKPYVGIGYNGRISSKDPRWMVGFDVGAMFLGSPSLVMTRMEQTSTYNEKTDKFVVKNYYYDIDINKDIYDYTSNFKSKVNFLNSLKVYPVLELRLSYKIF